MEFFNQEYAELASDCNQGIQNKTKNDQEIATLWTRSHNARNFAVFGDPAVKVAVGHSSAERTEASEPIIWFKPSGRRLHAAASENTLDSENTLVDRLTQLEKQVQALQAESASQRQEIENLKRAQAKYL